MRGKFKEVVARGHCFPTRHHFVIMSSLAYHATTTRHHRASSITACNTSPMFLLLYEVHVLTEK